MTESTYLFSQVLFQIHCLPDLVTSRMVSDCDQSSLRDITRHDLELCFHLPTSVIGSDVIRYMQSIPAGSRVPPVSDLFHGSPNTRAMSNVTFRYIRIRAALDTFTKGNQTDDRRRRRWRVGLYREVVRLSPYCDPLFFFFSSSNHFPA